MRPVADAVAPFDEEAWARERERRARGAEDAGFVMAWDDARVQADGERLRIDKWLWAARLAKTRGLAVEAVNGGRVQVNGQRVKPSREVRAGDRVEVTLGQVRRTVVVRGIAPRRGPASEAALLYEETAESREAREREAAQRRLAPPPGAQPGGRPTKRDRRRLDAVEARRRGRG